MSQDLADDSSTSIQVMVWCHHATRHYLNNCLIDHMALLGYKSWWMLKDAQVHFHAFVNVSSFGQILGCRMVRNSVVWWISFTYHFHSTIHVMMCHGVGTVSTDYRTILFFLLLFFLIWNGMYIFREIAFILHLLQIRTGAEGEWPSLSDFSARILGYQYLSSYSSLVISRLPGHRLYDKVCQLFPVSSGRYQVSR